MTARVLLDTDIGSDIDDAVCLAYLLARTDCDLLGITTVSGEALQRARLADMLCRHVGREIPIFPGLEEPLLIQQRQPSAPQSEALARWDHRRDFPRDQALEFMRKTIRTYPGEVTLLAIGPLTNVALLFTVDPEIPRLLKSLVTMGGAFHNQDPETVVLEWNAICDPHAAAIVCRAPVSEHRAVGLEVTRQLTMSATEAHDRMQGPCLAPVMDMAGVWFRTQDRITFHDPLAGAVLFEPELCTFERGTIVVDLTASAALGMTKWSAGEAGRHRVAVSVRVDEFFRHFYRVLG